MSNYIKILKREESNVDGFLLGKRICLSSHYSPSTPPQRPAPQHYLRGQTCVQLNLMAHEMTIMQRLRSHEKWGPWHRK